MGPAVKKGKMETEQRLQRWQLGRREKQQRCSRCVQERLSLTAEAMGSRFWGPERIRANILKLF